MLRNYLLVGLGGAAGSILRYAISMLLPRAGKGFPWATFSVNLAGCLLIGVLASVATRNHWMSQTGWPLLAAGLCGGFTTFSAFALDGLKLWENGATTTAAIYTVLSVTLGLACCFAGYSGGKLFG